MPRPHHLARPPPTRLPPRARRLALALALGAAAGCASFDQELHLAPLYSNLSAAGGGRETEALAGAVRLRRATPDGRWTSAALRPLVSRQRYEGGDSLTHFLVPLGTRTRRDEERTTQLLPIFRYQQDRDENDRLEWKLIALPGILWSQDDTGRIVRAFFPFGGVIEGSFTYDSIVFALFPLFVRTQREGRTSYHFLFPIFAWSTKPGLPPSWRVWPLYGVSRSEHRDRRFWLWPLFHTHDDHLSRPRQEQERKWMLFPLFGHTRRGSFRSTSVLWPFFGWSRDTESGFWAWDGPWPLVRIQRPGSATDVAWRTRLWPVYSYFRGDDLESTWVLWPLINFRSERYRGSRREGTNLVPFWQRWERFDATGEQVGSWSKLWPLYQEREELDVGRFALPTLIPLWHTPVIDDHYAWIYELYTREWDAARSRERSWGGLWRRDVDAFERRSYLSGLWARRDYAQDGVAVRETSLLFGLLRWRSRSGRLEGLLAPALPGPGFPLERSREPLEGAP